MEKVNPLENDGEDPLGPQPGPQEDFCASTADIVIYGGSAGGGKSYGILLESTRNIGHPNYNGIIFRRTYPQITSGGGLWDTSRKVYPRMGGADNISDLTYKFPSGAFIKFGHMQHEKNMYDHQGAAYPFLGFDELTHFSRKMFFYLLTRNRAPAGYNRPCYCRATTNPEPGWVADMIAWWWNPETGYAIKERSGIIRYFIIINDEVVWVAPDHRDKRGNAPLSITFIPATLDDNPALKRDDPRYEANLLAQDRVTRERLLHGNWRVSYAGGMFNPEWFKIIEPFEVPPPNTMRMCRYWDFAASEVKDGKDPDWTAGPKCGVVGGDFYVLDVARFREAPGKTEKKLMDLAKQDGRDVAIAWEEEKGSAGKFNTHHMVGKLLGYELHPDPVVGDKVERAKPLASAAEHGHVYLVRGAWNAQFIAEAGAFPLGTRDVIDATDGAMKVLTTTKRVWPMFSAGQVREFAINANKIGAQDFHYGAIVQSGDMAIYFLAAVWDSKKGVLWIYNCGHYDDAVADLVVPDMIKKMSMYTAKITRIVGNDNLFATEGRNTASIIRAAFKANRISVGITEPPMFDPYGSAMYANSLFAGGNVAVHKIMIEPAAEFAEWAFEDSGKKFKAGYWYCQALCLIASELKRDITDSVKRKKMPDYAPKYQQKQESKENWQSV